MTIQFTDATHAWVDTLTAKAIDYTDDITLPTGTHAERLEGMKGLLGRMRIDIDAFNGGVRTIIHRAQQVYLRGGFSELRHASETLRTGAAKAGDFRRYCSDRAMESLVEAGKVSEADSVASALEKAETEARKLFAHNKGLCDAAQRAVAETGKEDAIKLLGALVKHAVPVIMIAGFVFVLGRGIYQWHEGKQVEEVAFNVATGLASQALPLGSGLVFDSAVAALS